MAAPAEPIRSRLYDMLDEDVIDKNIKNETVRRSIVEDRLLKGLPLERNLLRMENIRVEIQSFAVQPFNNTIQIERLKDLRNIYDRITLVLKIIEDYQRQSIGWKNGFVPTWEREHAIFTTCDKEVEGLLGFYDEDDDLSKASPGEIAGLNRSFGTVMGMVTRLYEYVRKEADECLYILRMSDATNVNKTEDWFLNPNFKLASSGRKGGTDTGDFLSIALLGLKRATPVKKLFIHFSHSGDSALKVFFLRNPYLEALQLYLFTLPQKLTKEAITFAALRPGSVLKELYIYTFVTQPTRETPLSEEMNSWASVFTTILKESTTLEIFSACMDPYDQSESLNDKILETLKDNSTLLQLYLGPHGLRYTGEARDALIKEVARKSEIQYIWFNMDYNVAPGVPPINYIRRISAIEAIIDSRMSAVKGTSSSKRTKTENESGASK